MQLAAFLAPLVDIALFRNADLLLRRRTVTTNEHGISTSVWADTRFSGTVDPSQSETLSRMLEGQNLSGAIMVHTRTPLTAGSESRAADILVWKGRDYEVRAVTDWTEGGPGFVSAACTLMALNPPDFL